VINPFRDDYSDIHADLANSAKPADEQQNFVGIDTVRKSDPWQIAFDPRPDEPSPLGTPTATSLRRLYVTNVWAFLHKRSSFDFYDAWYMRALFRIMFEAAATSTLAQTLNKDTATINTTLDLDVLTLAIVFIWAYSLRYDNRVSQWPLLQTHLASALVYHYTARRVASGDGATNQRDWLKDVALEYIVTTRECLEKRLDEGTESANKVYSRIKPERDLWSESESESESESGWVAH
jgi:hypothetical protein